MAKKLYEVRVKEVQVRTLIYEVEAASKAGALRQAKFKHAYGKHADEIYHFEAYSKLGEPLCLGVKQ